MRWLPQASPRSASSWWAWSASAKTQRPQLKSVVALFVLLPCLVLAQEGQVPPVSVVPLDKMAALEVLAGRWTMTVYSTEDDGENWTPAPSQAVDIQYRHKNFLLEETPSDLESPGFHMHTFLTYDQYRGVYRKAALDDIWGILDLYEGDIDDGWLILDNLKSATFFPVGENQWRGFRLRMELKSKQRWMWIDKTDDNGQSWQPAFKAEYVALDR